MLMNEKKYRTNKDKKIVDLRQVEGLARIGATREEIAIVLGCSTQWLSTEENRNPQFAQALAQGAVNMKHSLRRAQIDMALGGSAAMLIWLGKQHLGQSDKQELNKTTEINITVQRAMDELRNIPRDQLLSSYALLHQAPVTDSENVIENAYQPDAEADPPPPC